MMLSFEAKLSMCRAKIEAATKQMMRVIREEYPLGCLVDVQVRYPHITRHRVIEHMDPADWENESYLLLACNVETGTCRAVHVSDIERKVEENEV